MTLFGLVCLSLVWSAALWILATALSSLKPSPRAAQAIWRGAAVLMFAPFVASAFMPGFTRIAAEVLPDLPVIETLAIQPGVEFQEVAAPSFRMPQVPHLILGVLAAGWFIRGICWGIGQYRLQHLKRRARRVSRPVGHWAEALGLRRVPDVRVIPQGAPFLAGLLRPVIYIPAALVSKCHAPQIIVHEMVHLKRGDLMTRPFDRLVADIFWFSPFAWAMRERLDYWREAIVDEETADLTGDRIAYARALTQVARHARPPMILPVAAFTLKKEGTLKMRLTQLLTDTPHRPGRLGLAVAAALLLATPLALAQGSLIRGAAALPAASLTYSHPVLDKAKLTSAFGMRTHPLTGEAKFHRGIDLAEEEGKPVYAPAAAMVTRAEMTGGYGNLVEISAGNTVLRFGQLKDIKVTIGEGIAAGTIIGTLGQSGQATGPHLHLEIWRDGVPVDPMAEEGLELAGALFIAPTSGAKAPSPKSAPLPAQAPKPAAAPVPPVPPGQRQSTLEEIRGGSGSCEALAVWTETRTRSAAWDARRKSSQASNTLLGLPSKTDWVPKEVSYPRPSYPAEAIQQQLSGGCMVMFDLGTDGMPQNMLAECSDPIFESEAAALNGAVFEPLTNAAGEPVEVKGVTYPMEFCIA